MLVLFAFSCIGCQPTPVETPPPAAALPLQDFYLSYAASKARIVPWTGFRPLGDEGAVKLLVYVSLLDSFDSRIKSPAVFRFELYEYVAYSADHKGKRLKVWPDIDLVPAAVNNEHWREFLRAYEFSLDYEAGVGRSFVLQATCVRPDGRRLTDQFVLAAE